MQAQASDDRRATSGPLSSLDGAPIVIKEALDVVGFPSTLGWNYTYSGAGGVDLYPLQNAALVQRLLDAGAVVLGKTNIPPFSAANTRPITRNGVASWDGLTFNAVNPDLVPGASSTGTATAVAAGMAVWGIGEEVCQHHSSSLSTSLSQSDLDCSVFGTQQLLRSVPGQ